MSVKLGQKVKIEKMDVYKALAKQGFVFHDDLVDTLYTAHSTPGKPTNCILYGEGGYGKSEMTLAFLKAMGYPEEEIGVFSVSNETSVEEMFGNVDLEKLAVDKKYRIKIESSVWNKEVVVLEEAFDGNPATMAALKQMLTSGYFEYNDQKFKIKTKMVVICTNKSPNEFNIHKTDSIDALIQRFPIKLKVKWLNHTPESYKKLLLSRFPSGLGTKEAAVLAEIFADNRYEGKTISPRIAIQCTKVFLVNHNLRDLKLIIDDLPEAILTKYGNMVKSNDQSIAYALEMELLREALDSLKPFLDNVEKKVSDIEKIKDHYECMGTANALRTHLRAIKNDIEDSINVVEETARAHYQKIFLNRFNTLDNKLESIHQNRMALLQAEESATMVNVLCEQAEEREKLLRILAKNKK